MQACMQIMLQCADKKLYEMKKRLNNSFVPEELGELVMHLFCCLEASPFSIFKLITIWFMFCS